MFWEGHVTSDTLLSVRPPQSRAAVPSVLRCKVCWRIAAAVFSLILLVEIAIFFPSMSNFEDGELDHLSATATAIVMARLSGGGQQLKTEADWLAMQRPIVGIAIRDRRSLNIASAGERVEAPFGDGPLKKIMVANGDRCEIVFGRRLMDERYEVAIRIDTSAIGHDKWQFVVRISLLVALIVSVVTAGTMLIMHFAVLRPILRLRRSMHSAGASPERADEFTIPTRRTDELGEVIFAHNGMLGRIADGRRRDAEVAGERERYAARHDRLTGLPNRIAFSEHLQTLSLDGRVPACVATSVVDIADLSAIAAAVGVPAVETVLRELAARLSTVAGPSMVARIEANRFAIARLAASNVDDSAAFAEKLIRDVSLPVSVAGAEVLPVLNIGIALMKSPAMAGEDALVQAELALERTKAGPGLPYQFFEPQFAEEAARRQLLSREISAGLKRGEFELWYQPKYVLSNGTLAGLEALIRWNHPTRGLLQPKEFLDIAETTGLASALGGFVIQAACRQIGKWQRKFGYAPAIAINISAHQFFDVGLIELIRQAIHEADIPPVLLELEVTESAMMHSMSKTAEILRAIRLLGVAVAIDDFGTGYSSLSYLSKFELDVIKIDKSFVDRVGIEASAVAICEAIIRVGHALQLTVVAEGVETGTQLDHLRILGCDVGQGYFFAQPERVHDAEVRFPRAGQQKAA